MNLKCVCITNIDNGLFFFSIQKCRWLKKIKDKPSNLWIKKNITLFYRFDRDGNGRLDDNDIEFFTTAFQRHGCLNEEKTERMREKINAFFKLLNKGSTDMSLENFVKRRIPLVNNREFGEEVWEKYLKHVATLMFFSIDSDEDGFISLQEFTVFFKCIKVKEEYARKIFVDVDTNHDSKISSEEFVHAIHDFTYNEEDSPFKELFGPLVKF